MLSFEEKYRKVVPKEEFRYACIEILDNKGTFLTWSKNSREFLGFEDSQVINKLNLKDILEDPGIFDKIWEELHEKEYFLGYTVVKISGRGGVEVFILLWYHRLLDLVSLILINSKKFPSVVREYKTLFDALPEPIFILDKNFRIVKANIATAKALGMSINDILGKTCYEIVHESGEPPENCPHKKLLSDGKSHTELIYEKNLGGTNIVSTTPLFTPDGELIGSIHVTRNISEIKKLQEEYEFYFTYSPSVNIILDKDYRILKASMMASSVLGMESDKLIGKNFLNFLDKEIRDITRKKIDRVMEGLIVHPFIIKVPNPKNRKLKREILMSFAISPSAHSRGELRILSTGLDVTPIKEMQKELLKTEKKYTTIFSKSKDGIIVLDEKLNIMDLNGAAENLLGSSKEELTGMSIKSVLGPISKDLFKKLEPKKEVVDFPLTLKFNGEDRHYLITVVKFTEEELRGYFVYIRDITQMKNYEQELEKSLQRVSRLFDQIISAMSDLVETRDPYTAGHQRRVAEIAIKLANELKLDEERIKAIKYAGLTHDIGKIAIPSEILTKPGKLTEIEYEMIKMHPEVGYKILKDIDFPWPVAEIVYEHHERLDGSGYPRGLKNGKILMEARILAVADTVEAMSSHRPYRPALGIEVALEEIKKNRGKLYDPDVVDACLKIFRRGDCKIE